MSNIQKTSYLPTMQEYINQAGAGTPDAHRIITSDAPFEGSATEFVFVIETYTDGVVFTSLQESLEDVDAIRLNAGGAGYPVRVVIPGRFTQITPAAGAVVAGYVIQIQ